MRCVYDAPRAMCRKKQKTKGQKMLKVNYKELAGAGVLPMPYLIDGIKEAGISKSGDRMLKLTVMGRGVNVFYEPKKRKCINQKTGKKTKIEKDAWLEKIENNIENIDGKYVVLTGSWSADNKYFNLKIVDVLDEKPSKKESKEMWKMLQVDYKNKREEVKKKKKKIK